MLRPFYLNTTPLFNPPRTIRMDKYPEGYSIEVSVPENKLVSVIRLDHIEMFKVFKWYLRSVFFG